MKELSIEQKAKAYDEVIKKLRDFYRDYDTVSGLIDVKEELANLIPELKESEDEKIRKKIIKLVKEHSVNHERCQMEAWLEKQGEHAKFRDSIQVGDKVTRNGDGMLINLSQLNRVAKKDEKQVDQKPMVDKVEPKFKEGDWVVKNTNGTVHKVERVIEHMGNHKYGYDLTDGTYIPTDADDDYHLWTIQDAKDGDVLACESGWTCIFKKLVNDETFSSYCFMDNTKWFCETGSECHTLKEEFVKAYHGKIYPATKEQRDTLEKAMADAGYTFDFEKKELKDIQKPAEWSKEDETKIKAIEALCDDRIKSTEFQDVKEFAKEIKDWLKSLKDKVKPQPKQEWSEEDERIKNNLLSELTNLSVRKLIEKETEKKYASWLKSLRPQTSWKPSDEQMKLLREVQQALLGEDCHNRFVNFMYELKRLRGE